MTSDSDRTSRSAELTILRAYVSALSHAIRSPLSIIANDLAYYGSLLPGVEIGSTSGAIKKIDDMLRLAVRCLWEVPPAPFKPSALVSDLLAVQLDWPPDQSLFGNPAVLETLILALKGSCEEPFLVTHITRNNQCKLSISGRTQEHDDKGGGSYPNLREYCASRGIEVLAAPLADALIIHYAHEFEIRVDGPNVEFQIAFETAREQFPVGG